jgi:hypothetical protein
MAAWTSISTTYGRGFAGLNSHKASTTAIVRDVDGCTFEDLLEAVRSYRDQAGWTQDAVEAEAPSARHSPTPPTQLLA